MKTTKLFVIGMCLLGAACTEQVENIETQNGMPVSVYGHTRTIEEAIAIANDGIQMLERNKTRAEVGTKREIDEEQIKCITSEKTRGGSTSTDTLMYIVNFEDEQGFAVVSANPATEGLLAVTEMGSYDEETVKQNEEFSIFMSLANEYVSSTNSSVGGPLTPLVPALWGRYNIRRKNTTINQNGMGTACSV